MEAGESRSRLGSGEMELEEYARIADAEQRHWWYRSMPALARAVLGPSLRPGLRILDAGCGPGPNFEWLRPYGEVVGIDYSPEAIRLANARHPATEAVQGDIIEMPFADESFDLALEFTVLALVDQDQRGVDELARVTRRRRGIAGSISSTVPPCRVTRASSSTPRWSWSTSARTVNSSARSNDSSAKGISVMSPWTASVSGWRALASRIASGE